MRGRWARVLTSDGLARQLDGLVPKRKTLRRLGTAAVASTMWVGMLAALPATHASAATNTLSLSVESARDEPRALEGAGVSEGDAITDYKFIINVDDTGTTGQRTATGPCSPQDVGYPASCEWPSIHGQNNPSAVFTQGVQNDINNGLDLPDGRYLISVVADGYKMDGAHFTMPLADGEDVVVRMQPTPLPDSTLRAQVFSDVAPTNGTIDVSDPPLQGFVGHITDYIGEVQTDVYGNPLCTTYVDEDPVTHEIPNSSLVDGAPVVDELGLECLSDADGMLTIPHLGSNRYALSVTPPDGQTWIQTSTLEGNHDWDTWLMEGATGYDTEFAVAGEPVPQPIFGFAPPRNNLTGGTGSIKGVVVGIQTYTPPKGGSFDFWGGNTGTKIDHPISRPWVSLADLEAGDEAVYIDHGNANGSFNITGVPDGNYSLSWWDRPQNYNLNQIQVTVTNGEVVNMGNLPLNGWWTEYDGYIFKDKNRNGIKDDGEPGVPNFTLTMRRRENSLMDRGSNTVTTDDNGYYKFEGAYPLGEWVVMEAYSDSFYTTGVTYQADNQDDPTTVLGAGVDVSVLPIIGLRGSMDWGVHQYNASGKNGIDPRNGGIVGTVAYDTTRNELDPQFDATEDWSPGISGIPVNLYATVDCPMDGSPCDPTDTYQLDSDGSYLKGKLLNTYVTENWTRPTGCTARDVDGNALVHGVDENVLALDQENNDECIESFIQGVQYGPYPTDQNDPDAANFGASVDGNYGFGDGCYTGDLDASDPSNPVCVGGDFEALKARDYLVEAAIPDDPTGKPLYKVTREEDINIGNGPEINPQVPPPACAGALHTVDLAGDGTDGYAETAGTGYDGNGVAVGVTVAASDPTDNGTFLDIGGSPYEGSPEPLCDTKLVELNNGKSIVPIFNYFTDVPLPTRMRGLLVDDVRFSSDPRSTMFGEKAGVPFAPVGIYDFNNDLEYTVESDYNGVYDVLMPSTDFISCPTPAGVCANMYRFVGNDPGVPGALNPNFNPAYRTIATEFEAWPGLIIPTDLAPTQVGVTVESPGSGVTQVKCFLDDATPQLFKVSQPYVNGSGSFTIDGTGFGASQGAGEVTLDGTALTIDSWSNTQISVTVEPGTPTGPQQLQITADNGAHTVNALTFHVLGAGYNPNVYEVGPGVSVARYNPENAASESGTPGVNHAIQNALDDAKASPGNDLVVVYPGIPSANPRVNPRGAYYENLIMASPVKLQGVGPGGFQGNTYVRGSIIDASAFGGDSDLITDWYDTLGNTSWDGNQAVNDGEAIYVVATNNGTSGSPARQFTSSYKAAIDGFDIRGGNERGFPGNINDLTGGNTGQPPNITTQGGAIFANAYARHLQITNNTVQNNGGGYGTIRIGTPDLPASDGNQNNDHVRVANNRILANAGTNLAGGIGIFAGADNYEVANNDICGNFSLEYGAGLSVYGFSPDGQIDHNRIYLNESNDEGGGIMIAGELPAVAGDLSPGSGPVDIVANEIQANLANDDGGGLRFLMAGDYPMHVYNNMIVNNVSTHEGGGVALNDATNVRLYNNTVMKNMTTATAVTSNGEAMPAGLATTANSDQLQESLPPGADTFSNPRLFNNVFWDNRAGTRAGTTVTGLGLGGPGDIEHWDMGDGADATTLLAPTNSVVQQNNGGHPYTPSGTNSGADPQVVSEFDLSVSFQTWRQNPAFVDATLVAVEGAAGQMGNYHLNTGSPAIDLGAPSSGPVLAPDDDIDGDFRPNGAAVDAGADEITGGAQLVLPIVDNVVADPNPTAGAGSVALTATATAGTNPVTGAEYFIDTDPGAGNATGMTVTGGTDLSATVDVSSLADGSYTIYVRAQDSLGNWGPTASTVLTVSQGAAVPVLYFSTTGNGSIPGVASPPPFDNSDIYTWNSSTFGRELDATAISIPAGENVDAFDRVDATHFYMSFSTNTALPGIGGVVQDEDVVYYDNGTWSVFFDGTGAGLTGAARDIDALTVAPNGNVFFSTRGNVAPPGVGGTADNADIYRWSGTAFNRAWDATANGLSSAANVDALTRVDGSHLYVSFTSGTAVPGNGNVQDEDVVYFDTGTWSVYFDGTAPGLTGNSRDVDAIDVP